MIFCVCTIMLYSADATVRVLTVPAFLDVIATMVGWRYGSAKTNTDRIQVAQGLRSGGRHSSAIKSGRTQSCVTVHSRNLSFSLSDRKFQNKRFRMKITYAGIVSRFVSKVPNPAALKFKVRYAAMGL